MVVHGSDVEVATADGPVRSAVRSAFANPRLIGPLRRLRMDPDRMIDRITADWDDPTRPSDAGQMWEKTDGSTIVRWFVDRR